MRLRLPDETATQALGRRLWRKEVAKLKTADAEAPTEPSPDTDKKKE